MALGGGILGLFVLSVFVLVFPFPLDMPLLVFGSRFRSVACPFALVVCSFLLLVLLLLLLLSLFRSRTGWKSSSSDPCRSGMSSCWSVLAGVPFTRSSQSARIGIFA